ncbi:MAG: hypothetical protein HW402_1007 [Dehalococcoidales bacterium]|nr:hypothetical protein [Dehalococcoidales bacterium]
MLPPEVKEAIGKMRSIRVFEVEKGAIKKFADAVDDRNPCYWDEEYARKSRHGSIIAPPGFFGWPTKWESGQTFPLVLAGDMDPRTTLAKAGYDRTLDGGIEYEFFLPVRAGDTLMVTSVIKDIREREGSASKLAFVITEVTYVNQHGDLVARAQATSIHR